MFVVCGAVADPGRVKAGLADAVRAAVHSLPDGRGVFAVSASFVGTRNFSRFDVEDLVGERIARVSVGDLAPSARSRPPCSAAGGGCMRGTA